MANVSVLIPVKNGMPYLEPCLESIAKNTCTNYEVILVDDHSTDDTFSFLEGYTSTRPLFKCYKNKGVGIIDALTTALENAKGQFITRMDADDLMAPNKITTLYKTAIANPASLIVGKVAYFSESSLGAGYERYATWLNQLIDNKAHYKEVYYECVIPSPNWMLSRDILEEIGGFGSRYPEDYDLAFRLYENQIPIIGIDEVLHYWRDHASRASRNDDNYADNHFLSLKLHYFFKISRNEKLPLAVLGAGKKGKKLAQALLAKKINFDWFTNNPKKVGKEIYGLILKEEASLIFDQYQLLIAVSNPSEKSGLKQILVANGLKEAEHFFFLF